VSSFRAALIAALLLAVRTVMLGQPAAQPTIESVKARVASYPPDLRVYALFRFWLTSQPPAVQKQFDDPVSAAGAFDLYRQSLLAEGESGAEAERKVRLIQSKREDLEIQLWNQILTSDSPRLNREPNALLVEVAKNRKPGRALDVGMGQGRNAIWLAQQGWDTTGFDPAEQAVAVARRSAEQRGLTLRTVVAKDSAFDFGESKWDLILLSYVDMRHLAARVVKTLAPGGIVVAEYFHQDSAGVSGGFADKELASLFTGLRVLRYEDTEGISDFGKTKDRLVRLAAEKRGKP